MITSRAVCAVKRRRKTGAGSPRLVGPASDLYTLASCGVCNIFSSAEIGNPDPARPAPRRRRTFHAAASCAPGLPGCARSAKSAGCWSARERRPHDRLQRAGGQVIAAVLVRQPCAAPQALAGARRRRRRPRPAAERAVRFGARGTFGGIPARRRSGLAASAGRAPGSVVRRLAGHLAHQAAADGCFNCFGQRPSHGARPRTGSAALRLPRAAGAAGVRCATPSDVLCAPAPSGA